MITYVRLVYFLVVLSILLREAATQTGTDAKNLRTQLFVTDGYDAKVRSASNVSDPTGTCTVDSRYFKVKKHPKLLSSRSQFSDPRKLILRY